MSASVLLTESINMEVGGRWVGGRGPGCWTSAHSGTYSYRSLLIQMISLSLKVLDKTDNR